MKINKYSLKDKTLKLLVTLDQSEKLGVINFESFEEFIKLSTTNFNENISIIKRHSEGEKIEGFGSATSNLSNLIEELCDTSERYLKSLFMGNFDLDPNEFKRKSMIEIERITSGVDDHLAINILNNSFNKYTKMLLDHIYLTNENHKSANKLIGMEIPVDVEILSSIEKGYLYEVNVNKGDLTGKYSDFIKASDSIEKMVSATLEKEFEEAHKYKDSTINLIKSKANHSSELLNFTVRDYKSFYYTVREYWYSNMANETEIAYYLFKTTEFFSEFENRFLPNLEQLLTKVSEHIKAASDQLGFNELDLYTIQIKDLFEGNFTYDTPPEELKLSLSDIKEFSIDDWIGILSESFRGFAKESDLNYLEKFTAGINDNYVDGYGLIGSEYKKIKNILEERGIKKKVTKLNNDNRKIEKQVILNGYKAIIKDLLQVSRFKFISN